MKITNSTYITSIRKIAAEIDVDGGSVLVTGATGLIGSCLVDVFIEANHTFGKHFVVYALGRSKEKIYRRFGNTGEIHCIAQNVTETINIDRLNYIVHAASNADPKSYALYPVETILTNILGAKNVLEYAKKKGSRVLLTSSFEVYGKLNQDYYAENDYGVVDLDLIRSCYPESKRMAESLFKSYHDEYNVDCVTTRLSSIYGPTMQDNDSKAHAQFLRNGLEGKNIVLKSKGMQKRTYCYVMDAVSGLLAVLFHGASGEAYNVANDQSIATIAEVAQTIAEISGTKVVFDIPDDIESKGFSKPQNCILKTDKIKAIGWQGKYGLREGVSETLEILKATHG